MEERTERIKGLLDMMGQMDERGQEMTKIAAICLEIGVEIGKKQVVQEKEEAEENRDPA